MSEKLMNGLQVIIQTEQEDGSFRCEGFTGVPIVNPCFIVLKVVGSDDSFSYVKQLREELVNIILGESDISTTRNQTPCRGIILDFLSCHAHSVSLCNKLLVLVGDMTSGSISDEAIEEWAKASPGYSVLPVFPEGKNVSNVLPNFIDKINCLFWNDSVREAIPTILSIVGLTTDEFRVFISYRRSDTSALAEQLFDALSRQNYNVFLDRFRLPPGINFEVRLQQELADKSMVLLLESETIHDSYWTNFEIEFAKKHRLGLFAIQVPNGESVSGIDDSQRVVLNNSDFLHPTDNFTLTSEALERVVKRTMAEHDKALMRRRSLLRQNMIDALLLRGIPLNAIKSNGVLTFGSRYTSKEYSIWLTTRPPGLADFHFTDIRCSNSDCSLIIAPTLHFESIHQARINWLSSKSGIKCFDESQMSSVAEQIQKGAI
jgi:hypothetical protein